MSYDWQADRETFRKWLVTTVLTDLRNEEGLNKWSDLTEKFTKIDFGITINGQPVDADAFIDGVERNMHLAAIDEANERLKKIAKVSALADAVYDIQEAALSAMYKAVQGTVLHDYLGDRY